jgi:hypothetical protein
MKKLLLGLAALFTFSLVAPTIAHAEKGEKNVKKGKSNKKSEEPKKEEPKKEEPAK